MRRSELRASFHAALKRLQNERDRALDAVEIFLRECDPQSVDALRVVLAELRPQPKAPTLPQCQVADEMVDAFRALATAGQAAWSEASS